MVSFSEQVHTYDEPLETMALAHNLRYPSPYSRHVLSSDVISRQFVSPTKLRTRRLMLKKGKVPAWAPNFLLAITTSWVLEDSEIDFGPPTGPTEQAQVVCVVSRNIDHKTIMDVWEYQQFTRHDRDPTGRTLSTTFSRVHSDVMWPLGPRIERFGLSRVPKSTEKARAGTALVASILADPSMRDELLSSGPLNPYPFDPVHSPLSFEGMRHRLDEARRQRSNPRADSAASDETWQQSARRKNAAVAAAWPSWSSGRFDQHTNELVNDSDASEPGQAWRRRWKSAARTGVMRFRESVCAMTGFMCEPPPSKET